MAFMTRLNDSRIAVEIGVFTGYSSLVTMNSMVKNAGPNAHLFALDTVSYTHLDVYKRQVIMLIILIAEKKLRMYRSFNVNVT